MNGSRRRRVGSSACARERWLCVSAGCLNPDRLEALRMVQKASLAPDPVCVGLSRLPVLETVFFFFLHFTFGVDAFGSEHCCTVASKVFTSCFTPLIIFTMGFCQRSVGRLVALTALAIPFARAGFDASSEDNIAVYWGMLNPVRPELTFYLLEYPGLLKLIRAKPTRSKLVRSSRLPTEAVLLLFK